MLVSAFYMLKIVNILRQLCRYIIFSTLFDLFPTNPASLTLCYSIINQRAVQVITCRDLGA